VHPLSKKTSKNSILRQNKAMHLITLLLAAGIAGISICHGTITKSGADPTDLGGCESSM
jgi:hypothetical protein